MAFMDQRFIIENRLTFSSALWNELDNIDDLLLVVVVCKAR